MTNILSRSFPPPSNWQDFERLCFDLYSRIWQTNDAQMHGRAGQPQSGVDVYGRDRIEKAFVGVQCKGKYQDYENPLSERELRAEVEKAKSFRPALDIFILATTAPNDEAIQQIARDLTTAHKALGLFEVRVDGWTTLRQRVTDYAVLVTKYFDELAPVDVVAAVEIGIAVTRSESEQVRAVLQTNQTTIMAVLERSDGADRLQARIADAAKFIEEGLPTAALRALDRLWDTEGASASPRNRYRLRANIGFANLMVGDTTHAIAEMRAGAAEDPTWPGARAVLATAEFLEGHREVAFALADAALAEDSSTQQAATILVETAPATMTIADLQARIPASHFERVDLLLAFSHRARDAQDATARADFLARAANRAPTDWRVLAAQAEPLLEPIFAQEGMVLTHAVPAARVPDLERAIALLQKSWDLLMARDSPAIGAHVAANLIAALDIAGRRTEYELLLTKALNIAPDFKPLLRRYAQAAVEADDWAAARKALESIPADEVEVTDRLLKIQASIHLDDPREAVASAKALELEIGEGRQAEIAAAIQIEAAYKSGRLDDVLPELLQRWPASIMLRSVAHNNLSERDPRRSDLIREIKVLARAINDPADRLHAAEALYAARQFSAAADMYEGLYGPDKDTLALFRRIKSLFFAERRREARELFDSLSTALKAMPRYADLGAGIYEHAGLLREARAIQEVALAEDDTLRRRVHWLALSERMGDTPAIVAWLSSVTPEVAGAPQDVMTVALAIDRLQDDPRCFAFAYRALRAGYSDPSLHLAYMMGLVFSGRSHTRAFSPHTLVASGTAVLLEEKDGQRKLVRVLETEPDPKLERGEIAPDSELGPTLLGKKVGDEVEVPSLGTDPTVYVIREIRDKYLHAHFRSLEQFETLFPGHQAFGSFHIDERKGADKFKPIFDSVKRRGEFALQLTEMYRKGQLPVMLMAKYSGVSPCDTWDHIVARPDLGFRVCVGHPQELANAQAEVGKNGTAVVDALTLYGLTRLGIAEKVRACFEDLGVVQTTRDLFRRLLHERTQERGKRHGTLGWDGEHYRMMEVGESYDDEKIAEIKAALDFAESLTLVAAEPSAAMKMDMLELFEDSDPSFLDTIYAVQGNNRLLLCDDQMFRQLTTDLSGVAGVWTQIAAACAAPAGRISGEDYYDIVGTIAAANYRFTSIDNRVVLSQLRKTGWAIAPAIETLASQIASSTNEIGSVTRLLADTAQFGWPEKPTVTAYTQFFAAVFKAFRRLQPAIELAALANAVVWMVQGRLRSNGYRMFLKNNLMNSTVYTSADRMLASIAEVADATLQPLADAISRATAMATASNEKTPNELQLPHPVPDGNEEMP